MNIEEEVMRWIDNNKGYIAKKILEHEVDGKASTPERIEIITILFEDSIRKLNFEGELQDLRKALKMKGNLSGTYFFNAIIRMMHEKKCCDFTSKKGREIRKEVAEQFGVSESCMERSIRYMIGNLDYSVVEDVLEISVKKKLSMRKFINSVAAYFG